MTTAAALALASCGGGGSGGGDTPTPIATASPSPTPTPTPTPTPVAATVRVFGPSPATGRLDFSNSDQRSDGVVQGFTARDGQYYPGHRNALFGYQGVGAGGDGQRDNADKVKWFAGVDHSTSLVLLLLARADAKMVTPVTGLLWESGTTQAKLKTQLGITGGLFRMSNDPDLLTYDGIAALSSTDTTLATDGEKMAAANMRVLATNAGLSAISYRVAPFDAARDVSLGFNEAGGVRLSACLRDAPAEFVFSSNAHMVAIAQCHTQLPAGITGPSLALRPQTWSAIAHLINAYVSAIGTNVRDDFRARWLIGIKGYLVPMGAQVAAADNDAVSAAAIAVSSSDIIAQTARYAEYYPYNATGLFMPVPDFVTVAAGGSTTVPVATLRNNDIQYGAADNGGVVVGGTIQSVNVPAANAGQVSASLANGVVSIAVAAGFRGATWFDYVTRSAAGEDRPARVYVRAL